MKRHTTLKPKGFITSVGPYGEVEERDTLQCVHCGAHWVIKPGSGKRRGWCLKCMGPVCGKPDCLKSCYPVEKRLEDIESGRIVLP